MCWSPWLCPQQRVLRKQVRTGHLLHKPCQIIQVHAQLQKRWRFSLYREAQGADKQQRVQAAWREVSPDFYSLKKIFFFTVRTITHWKIIPRDRVEPPQLEAFKMQLDWVTIFPIKKLDQMIFGVPFQSGLDIHVQKVSYVSTWDCDASLT